MDINDSTRGGRNPAVADATATTPGAAQEAVSVAGQSRHSFDWIPVSGLTRTRGDDVDRDVMLIATMEAGGGAAAAVRPPSLKQYCNSTV